MGRKDWTGRIGLEGQNRKDRTLRTVRTGQEEPDRKDLTGGIRHEGQDRKDRTAGPTIEIHYNNKKIGKDRMDRIRSIRRTGRTGQERRDRKDGTEKKRQPGQDNTDS